MDYVTVHNQFDIHVCGVRRFTDGTFPEMDNEEYPFIHPSPNEAYKPNDAWNVIYCGVVLIHINTMTNQKL